LIKALLMGLGAGVFNLNTTNTRGLLVAFAAIISLSIASHSAASAQTSVASTFPLFADGPFHEIESKYIFGFTDGSDIGAEGEKAIELETTAGFARRGGRYAAIEQELEFEHVVTQNFGYELSAHGVHTNIRNVEGMDDAKRMAFGGLSAKFRYLVLGRGPESPIGLTVSVEPEWARVEVDTGANAQIWGAKFKVAADTELVTNRLYLGANLIYAPEVVRDPGVSGWERGSSFGITSALAYRLTPTITVGAEVEHYRVFDGLYLNYQSGHAWYVGPTMQIQFTKKIKLAAAFSTQVAGHSVGDPRRLDLTNFEKYRANMKFEVEF
jgi:hypothetical protein